MMSIAPTTRENYLRTCAVLKKIKKQQVDGKIDLADGRYHHIRIAFGKIFIDGKQRAQVLDGKMKDCDQWLRFVTREELVEQFKTKYCPPPFFKRLLKKYIGGL